MDACASADRTGPLSLRTRVGWGRRAGGGFALSETDAPQAPSPTIALRTLGGIDALIALQGVEDPVERRRRAIEQGRRALDALDELKLGLLGGSLDQAMLLAAEIRRRRPQGRLGG